MRKITYLIIFLVSFSFYQCQQNKSEEEKVEVLASLEGTWRLVSYIDNQDVEAGWKTYDDNILYLKHITPSHFSWVNYDKSKDVTIGTGGGTYTYDDQMYTEDIEYFYPPGSSELGQAIPFTVEFKDGKWYHTGFAKRMELDPDTGEMYVADSSKIEEIWERVDNPINEGKDILGSWKLLSFKNEEDSMRLEHPEYIGYIKHITPSHFNWVFYNKEGDEIYGQGGGHYEIKDGQYIEKIEYMFPRGTNQVGTVLPFDMDIRDMRWYHTGYIKMVEDGEVVDSQMIDEIWVRTD